MTESFCKCQILGFVGADPSEFTLPNGVLVVSFNVGADQRSYDSATGTHSTHTQWHRVIAYGKKATEIMGAVKLGCRVFVEGDLHIYRWQERDSGREVLRNRIILQHYVVLQQPLVKATRPVGDRVPLAVPMGKNKRASTTEDTEWLQDWPL